MASGDDNNGRQARPASGKRGIAGRSLTVPAPVRKGLGTVRQAGRDVRSHLPHIPPISTIPQTIKQVIRNPQTEMRNREGLTPEAALHATYNFRRGVYNGIMFTLVDALMAPSLVLALFISRLGAPNVLVGLLPALLSGGWLLPQIFIAGRVQGMPKVMPWYTRAGAIRALSFALLAVATVFLHDEPTLLLIAFFGLYSVYTFLGGITGINWLEMVAKSISPRRRGAFFGQRNFWGGLLALVASAPIGLILSEELLGLVFPYNFALLFAIASVVVAFGVYFWSSMKEPVAVETPPSISIGTMLKRGFQAYKQNVDYRSYMVARLLLSLAAIADPFFVVFAQSKLGAPPATVGLYLGALSISSLLSNLLWSPLADRVSNRRLMALTVVAVALVPLTATILSLLIGSVSNTVLYAAFTLVFVFSGLALGASRIVNMNLVLIIAPPAERATYVGFLNLILGIVIFVPVIGGLLVDLLGFELVFFVSLLLSTLAMLAAARMSSQRPEA